jgi:hypothetical protein
VVTPALAQAIEAGITLRPSFAAFSKSFSAADTAFASRDARHSFNLPICSASTSAPIVRIEPSAATSGEGSLSTKRLTPTTISSPRSIDSRRRVLLSTSCAFM